MIDELKEEEIVNKVGGRFQALDADPEAHDRADQGARALVECGAPTR